MPDWWDSLPDAVKRAWAYANNAGSTPVDPRAAAVQQAQRKMAMGLASHEQRSSMMPSLAIDASGVTSPPSTPSTPPAPPAPPASQPMSQPTAGGGYGGPPPPGPPVVPSGSTPESAVAAAGAPNYGPAGRAMPWPGQVNPTGATWMAQHPAAVAAGAGAAGAGGAGAGGAGGNVTVRKASPAAAAPNKTGFVQIAAPNMVGMNGALGRGGARPMISALDLSSMFGNVPNPS